jgi:hypothetical protein
VSYTSYAARANSFNGFNPDGIEEGDRVEVVLNSGAVEWGIVSFCLGSDCCVVPNHCVENYQCGYERRAHLSQVRRLNLLEILADPVPEPGPDFFDYFNRGHRP